jgi:hypothetical protein
VVARLPVADTADSGPRTTAARAHARAWLTLVGALALHVADEASTGFLDFYNPLVIDLRARLRWFPARPFEFWTWLAALVVAVLVLATLSVAVRRDARGMRVAGWVFAGIMALNGLGHLAGSIYFGRWLPGATSAPLLIVASLVLARAAWRRPAARG